MNRSLCRLVAMLLPLLGVLRGAPSFDETMQKAAADYRQRIEQAAAELNRTRLRVADEKAPLLRTIRAAEERIRAAETEAIRLETRHADAADTRRKGLREVDALRKSTTYVTTLAHDAVKAAADGLAPGEDQRLGERLLALQRQLEEAPAENGTGAALDGVEFLLARTEQALGGYRADGRAMIAATNEVVPGTFAFLGPETFFQPAAGGMPGAVRPRTGAKHPVVYALPQWQPDAARALFAGQPALVLADASGGKALRLDETRGTLWQHIQKGGVVAFAIILVGAVAALMIAHKLRDLRRMKADDPATVEAFLALVAAGDTARAAAALPNLQRTTRELYTVGLRHLRAPKPQLEERLQAVLLEQRLHYERRLPLLAVIATAAPLMGLLGTVVGMVKTFALITVFGTGNAGKLSSGISEVLVATELGLVVAIPTLVIHGFLAQRVHRNLALLERYALQFTTAAQAAPEAAEAPSDTPVLT